MQYISDQSRHPRLLALDCRLQFVQYTEIGIEEVPAELADNYVRVILSRCSIRGFHSSPAVISPSYHG